MTPRDEVLQVPGDAPQDEVLQVPQSSPEAEMFRGSQHLARLELGDVTTFPEEDKVSPHQFPTAGNLRV